MKKFNTHEAKSRLSELLSWVERGESVFICRNGVVVAELRSVLKLPKSLKTESRNKMKILGDILAPLPDDDWSGLH